MFLLGLRPKGQVVLPLIFLHVEIHSLFELVVVHPYQVTFCIKNDGATCRTLHQRPSRGEENVAVVAPGIPLCYLGCGRLKINGMEMLTRIHAIEAQVIGIEGKCSRPGHGKSCEKEKRSHDNDSDSQEGRSRMKRNRGTQYQRQT